MNWVSSGISFTAENMRIIGWLDFYGKCLVCLLVCLVISRESPKAVFWLILKTEKLTCLLCKYEKKNLIA